jgi:hypothetical protein
MANRARYVSGDVKLIPVKTSASFPFEKSDLLYLDPDDGIAKSVLNIAPNSDEAVSQLSAAQYFLGVANESNGLMPGQTTFKQNGNFEGVALACSGGRFEFDCPSQIFTPNQPVGVFADTDAVYAQQVDALASPATLSQAIGYAVRSTAATKDGVARTRVIVEIQGNKTLSTTPVAGSYSGTSGQ